MQPAPAGDITRLLDDLRAGRGEAHQQLAELVYAELRRIAARHMRRERADHTLQPTVLVHDAYVSLVHQSDQNWHNRAHFFAVAGKVMRRILVNYARTHTAAKRGGARQRVEFDEALQVSAARHEQLLALDSALDRLAALDQRQAQIVELRFFAGLTEDEVAEAIGVSARTVKRDWAVARAWLRAEIAGIGKE